ncbi:MAG: mRNA interferase MazF [Sphingomonadales bacterium]|jgi:mRNA interferase MazF|nr:mRNA interferase MazF [Sphingomonadales bacterium]
MQAHRENGLLKPSELMVDVLVTVRRDKVGEVIGRLNDDEMYRAEVSLRSFLNLAR